MIIRIRIHIPKVSIHGNESKKWIELNERIFLYLKDLVRTAESSIFSSGWKVTVKLWSNKACGLCNVHKPEDFKAKCVFYITCRFHDCTIFEADISGLRSIKALNAFGTFHTFNFNSWGFRLDFRASYPLSSWFRSGLREIWEVFTLKTFEFEVVGSTKYLDGCLGPCWDSILESISRILIHILVHKWATRG